MSRIYVKNLHMNCTEADIRAHFKACGTVTDVTMQYGPDGHFKRIAFVGFYDKKFPELKKQFDGSYMKGSKISIYEALSHADAIEKKRKRSAITDKNPDEKKGAQQMVKKIFEDGGAELQNYLKMTTQKTWQNELLDDAPILKKNEPNEPENQNQKQKQEKELDPTKAKIKNLPKTVTEAELAKFFKQFGPVSQAVVSINPVSKEPTGVGFIQYETPKGLKNLLKKKEILMQGMYLQIQQASQLEMKESDFEFAKKAFDKHNTLAWNSLVQNQQNITNQLSQRLNIDHTQIQNNPVAMATGEALLNKELREKMTAAGLQESGPRSKTAILVKNLSDDVTEQMIRQQFGQFGPLLGCDLFFVGFCLVQFGQPSDARRAFNRLAFKKIGTRFMPMMLEWAILKDQIEAQEEVKEEEIEKTAEKEPEEKKIINKEQKIEPEKKEEPKPIEKPKPENTKSVHIKSISFQTTAEKFEQTLKQTLKEQLISCNLVQGLNGHKGFGFAVVKENDFQNTLQKINKIICDGFRFEATESVSKTQKQEENDLDTTKLIVKNLAFQASAKELKQLLSQFGRVVSFRAPKKLDNTLRGFAFVEYATEKEAGAAMNLIKTTHFYGRHLVAEPSYEKQAGGAEDAQ
ncbi:Polyadenylate-binding_protein [Hexamita inflata]|uniref:Putative n=1 Tax=Hexamita inflata TaxID=28002 RepID=A0AA86TZZ4_9EUKA|nr:Polyadenylate-binding protein [Hexamita inflata]CAI9936490.1 Polyadenylate-binding protein [Hexamita inflata]